ncbi:MAG: CDP-glycerol glycerophosphotransferase family protein [Clostridia bacterium]|nr:CDP-glycerol glycerophosphotransferase family protein [Clostridia bacterium]
MRDNKLWIFNAGLSFDGNPKWLFMYIQNNRPDIEAHWLCYTEESMHYIKKLGYKAHMYDSDQAKKIGQKAGVYVVNQRKEKFQDYLDGITVLNLWHGVGCKAIEKNVKTGMLNEGLVKKNIINMTMYRNNELFLVTSPLMERHFAENCRLEDRAILRGAYPNCFSPDKVETYDHDILKGRNLPSDTKIAVYAPTYRESSATNFFPSAICDMDRLIECLEKNNMVLVFKLHPKMQNDFQYLNLKEIYKDSPRLIFWDNKDDMYEIFDKVELAIIDYSSIFYDLLARGVKHFIRYIFDIDNKENVRDFALDYMEHTCGPVCQSFDELIEAISNYKNVDLTSELERISKLFWEYAIENPSIDHIIDSAIDFKPLERELPTLYSFDIFDTLISRSVSQPAGVFYYVSDKMKASGKSFPSYLIDNYFKIRPWAESNAREYYHKSQVYRNSDWREISFDMIFEHMQKIYDLTDEQIALLKEWELEGEYRASTPIKENIEYIKSLTEKGEKVVLISDMYLPSDFIRKMLVKADPVFENIPIFVSSECGHQKTTKKLFLDVYHELEYNYGKWIHHGDNPKADNEFPRKLGIETIQLPEYKILGYEKSLNEFIRTYDGYQVSKILSDFRAINESEIDNFAYRYTSFYFVPYINWVIRHALKRGIECLYFVSRDGYHLKRIADAIIDEKKYPIKTKYIYGSRKSWRIPALIDDIDEEFWSEYGNFSGIDSFSRLIKASSLTEEQFAEMFPELMYLKKEGRIGPDTAKMLREAFRASEKYRSYLLEIAKEKRVIIEKYLKQEINFDEKYAFVEFWGRGYTQTSLAKILWHIRGKKEDNIFYYARTIYPTHDHIVRYNFTTNNFSLIFVETLFANLHYKSIEEFTENENGVVEPIIVENENDMELQEAMEKYLPEFARDYVNIDFLNEEACDRACFDFGLSYFHRHPKDPMWVKCFAKLKDSATTYGKRTEWAPPMRWKDIFASMKGKKFETKNMELSLQQSSRMIRWVYRFYIKHLKGKKLTERIRRFFGKKD